MTPKQLRAHPFGMIAPALVLGFTVSACGGDGELPSTDAGVADTGVVMDAGLSVDSGLSADGGLVDAGMADTGAVDASTALTFLSAAEVEGLMGNGGVQVVDVRSASAYAAGHIPNAVHMNASALRTTVDGVPSQVVARSTAEAYFEAAGLNSAAHIVLVGPSNDTGTSRALWTIGYYGASGTLSLLDGGQAAWAASGLALSTSDDTVAGTWDGAPTADRLRVDKEWLLMHYEDADVEIFDVRTPGEFSAGHIPGAYNANWTGNLEGSGLFKSLEDMRAYNNDPSAPTLVVYCQSGARASVGWTVLKALGYEDVRLYDGSWNEWGTDPATPKETGN